MREKLGIATLLLMLSACDADKQAADSSNPSTETPAPSATATPAPGDAPAKEATPAAEAAPSTEAAPSPEALPATGSAAGDPSATAATPPAGGTAAVDGKLIEAGCTYDGLQLDGADGATYRIACPAGCDADKRNIFGSGVYTADSHICKAGIHAGAIPATGGTFGVRLEPGRPAYRGSEQNGIKSRDFGKYKRSYSVITTATTATAALPASEAASAVIEAGCTYDANKIDGNEGATFRVACPAGCEKGGHNTYGTFVYTADSPICKAGVHAGAIPATGGVVTVRIDPGRLAYRGSEQNGVKSRDYGKYRRSFAVITAESAARPALDPSIIEAGCSYDADQLEGGDGTTYRVACPAGCEKGGQAVYGSDAYTAGTSICKAAIHAGAVPAAGGTVTVRLEPGRPAYRGSEQNGIKARDYGKYRKSFAVVKP